MKKAKDARLAQACYLLLNYKREILDPSLHLILSTLMSVDDWESAQHLRYWCERNNIDFEKDHSLIQAIDKKFTIKDVIRHLERKR